MTLIWILNILGIFIYYLARYSKRGTVDGFNPSFWIKDNWPELLTTLLINVGFILILVHPGTTIEITGGADLELPIWVTLAAKPLISFCLGLGLSMFFYRLFKAKIEINSKENGINPKK